MKHMKASLALALSFLLLPLGALAQSGGEDDANRPPKPPKGEKWQGEDGKRPPKGDKWQGEDGKKPPKPPRDGKRDGEDGKKPPKPPRDAQPRESSSGS